MTILDKILQEKRREVLTMLAERNVLQEARPLRPSLFNKLYKAEHLHVIAEMKRASPSKGLIAEGADPVAQAISYYNADAACISVLTDTPFFKGSFEDLSAVADNVPIPLLCKDFIVHSVQIDRAKSAGASVVLLIVAALTEEEFVSLYAYAEAAGLEVLVEVHDGTELKRALAVDAKLIGVNNRDLRTFTVDLKKTSEIAALFPFDEERVLISESGIWESEDALFVADAGASAVLVGESLMRSGEVVEAIRSLQIPLPRVVR
ncbi:indole-3-glycerol phosphate synthase TrpC [Sporosarcina sp. JAI121]|uniref:indole-3-glycerol phosphate synthase TrpC n=1 Tax=Sporosarcina sp. JAI121 TaxID=2723064 RepID=UPI0015CC52CC|nr:indole-3-glycerol phosphate synthase TrpC [Sporosarcina sp. JAI121]NYF25598.1 indole-3-glycerol phosphate synthase [Sporosarcina sp. JAI121]